MSTVSVIPRSRQATDERFMPVREAEQLLGLSRQSVLRRIKLGLLAGYPDPDSGYYFVSRESVEEALRRRRLAQDAAAAPFPGSTSLEKRNG